LTTQQLSALDVDSIRTLKRILLVEANGIAFMKLVEGNIDKSVTMEEEIILHPRDGDETEALVSESLDSTGH